MKFIVGIGNPERRYAKSRHNVGFQVVEALGGSGWKERSDLSAAIGRLEEGVYLVKPATFVNRTGLAARAIVEKYGAKTADVLFVCDDANLDFGKLRLRASGSAGGHHGLESVIERLESQDFPRLRIGIRSQAMPKELPDYVLGNFSPAEKKEIKDILDGAASVCVAWAKEGLNAAADALSRWQSVK